MLETVKSYIHEVESTLPEFEDFYLSYVQEMQDFVLDHEVTNMATRINCLDCINDVTHGVDLLIEQVNMLTSLGGDLYNDYY